MRNNETTVEVEVDRCPPARPSSCVFLDDLAERDTRFYVQLDWLAGPPARAALPFDGDPALVAAVEARSPRCTSTGRPAPTARSR